MTRISIKQIPWCPTGTVPTGTVTNVILFTDYHSIAESQQKAIISSDATVSFIFLYLWGLFLTEYFTSALDQVNIAAFSFKKNHKVQLLCIQFSTSLLVLQRWQSFMLQGEWRKDVGFNSNHVKVYSCIGASCCVQQPDFRRLFEEVMQSICSLSK